MPYCSVASCKRKFEIGKSVQFSRFPQENEELLKAWISNIKRNNFQPTEYSIICSAHFKEDDFTVNPVTHVKKLKLDAVPIVSPPHAKENISTVNESKRKLNYDESVETPSQDLSTNGVEEIEKSLEKAVQTDYDVKVALRDEINTLRGALKAKNRRVKCLEGVVRTHFAETVREIKRKRNELTEVNRN